MFFQSSEFSSNTYSKIKYVALMFAIFWAIGAYMRYRDGESPTISLILLSATLKMCKDAARLERITRDREDADQVNTPRVAPR